MEKIVYVVTVENNLSLDEANGYYDIAGVFDNYEAANRRRNEVVESLNRDIQRYGICDELKEGRFDDYCYSITDKLTHFCSYDSSLNYINYDVYIMGEVVES